MSCSFAFSFSKGGGWGVGRPGTTLSVVGHAFVRFQTFHDSLQNVGCCFRVASWEGKKYAISYVGHMLHKHNN